MRQALEAAREAWGLATMIGVAGKGETLEVVPRLLITGRRVTGSSFGGVKGRTQVPLLVERWLAGEIDVDSLLSHRLTLDEVNRGFELMEAQDGIRNLITFGLEVTSPGRECGRFRLFVRGPRSGGSRLSVLRMKVSDEKSPRPAANAAASGSSCDREAAVAGSRSCA